MKFTAQQISVLFQALYYASKAGQPRAFPLDQQNDASSAAKKVKVHSHAVNEGLIQFSEGECDFSVDEKKVLLDALKREWTIDEVEIKTELEKLLAI